MYEVEYPVRVMMGSHKLSISLIYLLFIYMTSLSPCSCHNVLANLSLLNVIMYTLGSFLIGSRIRMC